MTYKKCFFMARQTAAFSAADVGNMAIVNCFCAIAG